MRWDGTDGIYLFHRCQTWTLWTKVGDWTGKATEKFQDVSLQIPVSRCFQMFPDVSDHFSDPFRQAMTPKSAPGEGPGITTEIVAASNFQGPTSAPFYYAEDYHQQYLAKPGARPYCSAQPQQVLWQNHHLQGLAKKNIWETNERIVKSHGTSWWKNVEECFETMRCASSRCTSQSKLFSAMLAAPRSCQFKVESTEQANEPERRDAACPKQN